MAIGAADEVGTDKEGMKALRGVLIHNNGSSCLSSSALTCLYSYISGPLALSHSYKTVDRMEIEIRKSAGVTQLCSCFKSSLSFPSSSKYSHS